MNEQDLVDAVAKSADLSKTAAPYTVHGALHAMTASLKKTQPVSLIGCGTFKVTTHAAAPDATRKSARRSRSQPPRFPDSNRAKP